MLHRLVPLRFTPLNAALAQESSFLRKKIYAVPPGEEQSHAEGRSPHLPAQFSESSGATRCAPKPSCSSCSSCLRWLSRPRSGRSTHQPVPKPGRAAPPPRPALQAAPPPRPALQAAVCRPTGTTGGSLPPDRQKGGTAAPPPTAEREKNWLAKMRKKAYIGAVPHVVRQPGLRHTASRVAARHHPLVSLP